MQSPHNRPRKLWQLSMLCAVLATLLAACGSQPTAHTIGSPTATTPDIDTPEGAAVVMLTSPQFSATSEHTLGDWRALLDAPVLVHAYKAYTGVEYDDSDHWVASAKVGETRTGLYDFVYQRPLHKLRFGSFGSFGPGDDPRKGKAFPYLSEQAALTQLKSLRGLNAQAGTQPMLIFFPPDPSVLNVREPPSHPWTSGGINPMDPLWRITATDGADYFIGADMLVHTADELPVAAPKP